MSAVSHCTTESSGVGLDNAGVIHRVTFFSPALNATLTRHPHRVGISEMSTAVLAQSPSLPFFTPASSSLISILLAFALPINHQPYSSCLLIRQFEAKQRALSSLAAFILPNTVHVSERRWTGAAHRCLEHLRDAAPFAVSAYALTWATGSGSRWLCSR